jgi:hypothetical protein
MVVMMVMTARRKIMGKFVIGAWLLWLGGASTLAIDWMRNGNVYYLDGLIICNPRGHGVIKEI